LLSTIETKLDKIPIIVILNLILLLKKKN